MWIKCGLWHTSQPAQNAHVGFCRRPNVRPTDFNVISITISLNYSDMPFIQHGVASRGGGRTGGGGRLFAALVNCMR